MAGHLDNRFKSEVREVEQPKPDSMLLLPLLSNTVSKLIFLPRFIHPSLQVTRALPGSTLSTVAIVIRV